jgi:hypothetical protein
MAVFKELAANDFKSVRSFVDQIIDVTQDDISGSSSRQKYQHFVTGGVGPGVTSSLWQTVWDQDFTAETSNAVFDMTVGLYASGSIVASAKLGEDTNGKFLFPSQSMMMREKIFNYRQLAQKFLGDADDQFVSPHGSTTESDKIDAALVISFRRLFSRDQVKRETFVMGFYASASTTALTGNMLQGAPSQYQVFSDIGASANKEITFGGQVSTIVDSTNTSRGVGLMFNDAGVVVLDIEKILASVQHISGAIDAMRSGTLDVTTSHGQTPFSSSFVPNFLTSASIDDIVDHIASVRFGSGSLSAMTFQNVTNVNSTIITARLGADEFNYSSNPTYVDEDNRIVVIDEGQEDIQQSFTMLTTLAFYDANDTCLAVAKLSRPIEKSIERDLLLRTRLDF